jgi:hypothetical protein
MRKSLLAIAGVALIAGVLCVAVVGVPRHTRESIEREVMPQADSSPGAPLAGSEYPHPSERSVTFPTPNALRRNSASATSDPSDTGIEGVVAKAIEEGEVLQLHKEIPGAVWIDQPPAPDTVSMSVSRDGRYLAFLSVVEKEGGDEREKVLYIWDTVDDSKWSISTAYPDRVGTIILFEWFPDSRRIALVDTFENKKVDFLTASDDELIDAEGYSIEVCDVSSRETHILRTSTREAPVCIQPTEEGEIHYLAHLTESRDGMRRLGILRENKVEKVADIRLPAAMRCALLPLKRELWYIDREPLGNGQCHFSLRKIGYERASSASSETVLEDAVAFVWDADFQLCAVQTYQGEDKGFSLCIYDSNMHKISVLYENGPSPDLVCFDPAARNLFLRTTKSATVYLDWSKNTIGIFRLPLPVEANR